MAVKTNTTINGNSYFKISRKVGMRQNKQGVWVANYKNFYGKSKKEAENKYNLYMLQHSKQTNSKRPVGELIDEWIESSFMVSDLADGTKSKYVNSYLNNFKPNPIAGVPACDITPMHLQNFYNELDCVQSALRSLNNLLKKFFSYALRVGICEDITLSVELPITSKKYTKRTKTENNEVEVWEDDELKKLLVKLEETNHRLWFLVYLAVNTGARISELLALEYKDITKGALIINKQVTNVKTPSENGVRLKDRTKSLSSVRLIPLNNATISALEKHKERHLLEMERKGYKTEKIFTTQMGKYYDRRSVGHQLKRFYKSYGFTEHTFHSFRHTFGTNLSRAGVPIEETRALMGHSSIDMTAKYYINVSTDRKRNAVEKLTTFIK